VRKCSLNLRPSYTCADLDQGLFTESIDLMNASSNSYTKRVKVFIEQKVIHRASVLIFIVTHNHNASVVLVL